jgi:hypothetical protein
MQGSKCCTLMRSSNVNLFQRILIDLEDDSQVQSHIKEIQQTNYAWSKTLPETASRT